MEKQIQRYFKLIFLNGDQVVLLIFILGYLAMLEKFLSLTTSERGHD